ncbi:arylsulfatase [Portibacter marinus]|uniref:arylsulfatase n=1 Tax=Portibacter marinus TaxID=2898660 RepID=UPI001F15D663|nr:arylsulfatase [Portibacter marinus]
MIKSILLSVLLSLISLHGNGQTKDRPNVLLIITDDQGYGDLGSHGNPYISTPHLDAFTKQSVQFYNFYVSPVCAPTRASLMTGRYALRTGVRDTYNGGSIMSTEEYTLAELFRDGGYQTGIFGKWHLGDNYPSRPIDQGFDESVIHLSGGIGQVGDFTTYFQKDSSYLDPVLWHNGSQKKYQGYCSDIFTNEAIKFIEANAQAPFFCYLSFNAPHTPLQVPEKYYRKYKDLEPKFPGDLEKTSQLSERNKEDARKVYAMVENIDDNVGKVMALLKSLAIENNTIVIFMTDNGPQQFRYNGEMRGLKGSVYRGGTRVPFYLRYPQISNTRAVYENVAHIDVLPSLAELCEIEPAKSNVLDGKSFVPLIVARDPEWNKRSLFFYWTRKYPERYQNMALLKDSLKLIGHTSFDADVSQFELFNIEQDPSESKNILLEELVSARSLKEELDSILSNLIHSKNLMKPPLIEIGTNYENPTFLNRNDAGGQRGIWAQEEIFGKWYAKIHPGTYDIDLKLINPLTGSVTVLLEFNGQILRKEFVVDNEDMITLENVYLAEGSGDIIPSLRIDGRNILPFWVSFDRHQ